MNGVHDSLLPVFELHPDPQDESSNPCQNDDTLCRDMAACLRATGCLLVRDPRVSSALNDEFLDLMEAYFASEDNCNDIRPELSYQVGLTPSGVEAPRVLMDPVLQAEVASLPAEHAATMPTGPDVKCRFFWRVGPRPEQTAFPELNAQPVIPKGFPQWQPVLDDFASRMLGVARTVAACAARGLGLAPDAITQLMQQGPHLLAPTGSDLGRHGQLGTVLAGYHSDLNLLTLHGKSRFPGLFVWLADGRKAAVRVPPGCLLVQAGQQLEVLTGGQVKAGKHEVVVTQATVEAIQSAQASGRSTWRVSSTLFTHVASDALLQPLGHFATAEALAKYPPKPAGLQVQEELEAISLKKARAKGHGSASLAGAMPGVAAAPEEADPAKTSSNTGGRAVSIECSAL